jgi:hypothetical protein
VDDVVIIKESVVWIMQYVNNLLLPTIAIIMLMKWKMQKFMDSAIVEKGLSKILIELAVQPMENHAVKYS